MGITGNLSLFLMLVVVVSVIFYVRRQTSYTLEVTLEPQDAARISEIAYEKVPGAVVAKFSLRVKEGYAITKWTGTLPRLEGYDPAGWYDPENKRVRLVIDKNEKMTIHFAKVEDS